METSEVMRNVRNVTSLSSSGASSFQSIPFPPPPANVNAAQARDVQESSAAHAPAFLAACVRPIWNTGQEGCDGFVLPTTKKVEP